MSARTRPRCSSTLLQLPLLTYAARYSRTNTSFTYTLPGFILTPGSQIQGVHPPVGRFIRVSTPHCALFSSRCGRYSYTTHARSQHDMIVSCNSLAATRAAPLLDTLMLQPLPQLSRLEVAPSDVGALRPSDIVATHLSITVGRSDNVKNK